VTVIRDVLIIMIIITLASPPLLSIDRVLYRFLDSRARKFFGYTTVSLTRPVFLNVSILCSIAIAIVYRCNVR